MNSVEEKEEALCGAGRNKVMQISDQCYCTGDGTSRWKRWTPIRQHCPRGLLKHTSQSLKMKTPRKKPNYYLVTSMLFRDCLNFSYDHSFNTEYCLSRLPVSTQLFTEMLCSFLQGERMYANYQVDDFLILIPGAKQLVIKTFQEHEF